MTKKKTSLHNVEELMEMLTGGDLPDGMRLREQPQLSREAAFSVIWYLQEYLRILPDEYEMCDTCGELYDDKTCAWGYVDPSDDTWLDSSFTQDQVDAVAHMHFCCGNCMLLKVKEVTS